MKKKWNVVFLGGPWDGAEMAVVSASLPSHLWVALSRCPIGEGLWVWAAGPCLCATKPVENLVGPYVAAHFLNPERLSEKRVYFWMEGSPLPHPPHKT